MKNTIKIWPFIDGPSQAIIPYHNSNLNIEKEISIDFSNVRSINASGVAITVTKLLLLLEEFKNSRWSIEDPENTNVKTFLINTGVMNLLNSKIVNKSLFSDFTSINEISPYIQNDHLDFKITSLPLIVLDFDRYNFRICVEDFIDNLIKILLPYSHHYNFKLNILIKLIKEIAKNSEDHTSTGAIFGMDIIENTSRTKGKILFSFCDFGIGIHGKIKKFMANDKRYRDNVSTKMGIVDSYHSAYTPGFSTSKNNQNKGIGMAMILDCVKMLNLDLSIYDAKSMGFIPNINTHDEIRRNFWNTGNSVGFYYYGNLKIN